MERLQLLVGRLDHEILDNLVCDARATRVLSIVNKHFILVVETVIAAMIVPLLKLIQK